MPEHHLLGSHIRRFLLEHVVADRNLSRNTQRNYRDAIRVLLRFMTDRHRIDPANLTVEHVTTGVVREFLQYLEQERGNAAAAEPHGEVDVPASGTPNRLLFYADSEPRMNLDTDNKRSETVRPGTNPHHEKRPPAHPEDKEHEGVR
jgi:hypothetical protein